MGSISVFDRNIKINKNINGDIANFGGKSINNFFETSLNLNSKSNYFVFGLNFNTESFEEDNYGKQNFKFRNEDHLTLSAFANNIWEASELINLESGLRIDWNQNSNTSSNTNSKVHILPKISTLFKFSKNLFSRIGGGFGYRYNTIFNEEAEPLAFENVLPIDFKNSIPETSIGVNADITYQEVLNENLLLTFNNMFFYNTISNPIMLVNKGTNSLIFENNSNNILSKGFETQLKITFYDFTLFVGYTYTDIFIDNNGTQEKLVLNPTHSLKGDLLFFQENNWRICWDYEYKSSQRLSNNTFTKDLFTTGIVIEKTIDKFVIFFNAENISDVRQSKYGSIVSLPNNTPQLTEVWAPLDGRFLNFGLKIKF